MRTAEYTSVYQLVTRLHEYDRLRLGGMSCIHAMDFAFRDAHQLERDSAVVWVVTIMFFKL